jgi:DNA-binding NarL/FixJ family response regulator
MSVRAFMDSLAVVLAGEPVYPGCMLRDIVVAGPRPGAGMPPNRPGRPVDKLSERERMVLVSLTEGLSNKDIGRRLGLAENTVKVHLRRICRVLRVNNRTQAAVVGLKQLPEQSDTAP